jgi:hypothetical protein
MTCGLGLKKTGKSKDKDRATAKATTKTNAGVLRLRCSESAVSNFAQDDVRFGAEENRQEQGQRQSNRGERVCLPTLGAKKRAEDGAPMLLAWWRRTREVQGRVIGG